MIAVDTSTSPIPSLTNGTLIFEVKDGFVRKDDARSKGDPYVQIRYGGKTYLTSFMRDTYSPVFNEEFRIHEFNIDHNITVNVFDRDILRDDLVGSFVVSPRNVLESSKQGQLVEYPFGRGGDFIRIKLRWADMSV